MDIKLVDVEQFLRSQTQPIIALPAAKYRGWTVANGPLPTGPQEKLETTVFAGESQYLSVPMFPLQVASSTRVAIFAAAASVLLQSIPQLLNKPGLLFIGTFDDQQPNLRVWIGVAYDGR